MIETRGLTKRFGQELAVDGIDLHVAKGEVFGFLGPNGAGKTTTVRMLSCLIAPTSGEAWIGGLAVGRDSHEIRRNIGILTESPGLYDRLSARLNLDFYARLHDVPGEHRAMQVDKYLRLLGLWERRDDPVGTFSKGMKQKVAIARSLVHEPQVLFLDEPTAALDPEAAKAVRDFIAELKSEGRTIFLCTHNLDEADRLCDRIAVIRQRILATGLPADLRRTMYGRKTSLQLRTVSDPVVAAIRKLSIVENVERRDSTLIVTLSDPEEQNPLLIRTVVEAGGDVQFVTESQASLEEVYLSLVSSRTGQAET